MTAREDFLAAVREAATYSADEGTQGWLLTEAQFAAIDRAADAYRSDGLLSLAAALDRRVDEMFTDLGKGGFRRAATMARRAAESHRADAESAGPVSQDAGTVSVDPGDADCMEAGPE